MQYDGDISYAPMFNTPKFLSKLIFFQKCHDFQIFSGVTDY